jgi:hypothetical protein
VFALTAIPGMYLMEIRSNAMLTPRKPTKKPVRTIIIYQAALLKIAI